MAMILPFFKAALQGGRLGTHNIYPDSDGVARAYTMYHEAYGWRIALAAGTRRRGVALGVCRSARRSCSTGAASRSLITM